MPVAFALAERLLGRCQTVKGLADEHSEIHGGLVRLSYGIEKCHEPVDLPRIVDPAGGYPARQEAFVVADCLVAEQVELSRHNNRRRKARQVRGCER